MKAVAQTDQGRVRTTNQDTVYCSTKPVGNLPNLFVVADGMGGENAGDYASHLAIRELVKLLKSAPAEKSLPASMREALEQTNTRIFRESKENPDYQGMGTTLVSAMIEDGTLYVCNVGDSRLYVIGDSIEQVTRDHSYVEEMVHEGRMKRDSEEYRRKKNILMRAVGSDEKVVADFFERKLSKGDIILMCSDGLSNMLSDTDIFEIVRNSKSISAAAKTLIETANDNGGRDNVSVILISGPEGGAA